MSPALKSKVWPVLFALVLLALIAQSVALYPKLRVKDSEIATLRTAAETANRSLAERDAPVPARADELTRLRKENQELHRLRNEVRELREAQAAKAAQPAPAASTGSAELVAQLQRQMQQLQAENLQLRAAQQQVLTEQAQARDQLTQVALCINNLRHIDGAKQQWALENRQTAEALPEAADIEPYLSNPDTLICPAGGIYTLHAVEALPTCSIPNHVLP